MIPADTLLIKRNEVSSLLKIEDCIAAVENAFKMRGLEKANPPGILGVHAKEGGFHIKAGILDLTRPYFVAKINGNFPKNMQRHALPTIQGIIVVSDALNGKVLALIDSIEITILRTGAATAVAAKYLARQEANTATIIGCGNQGKISLRALMKVRNLQTVYAYDIDKPLAESYATELSDELKISVSAVEDIRDATRQSDICITCTPSKNYFLKREDIIPGTFVAAVGSDSEDKQELDPLLLSKNKVIVDSLEQCEKIGELHHAINAGLIDRNSVHAELGDVIAGLRKGRQSDDEIIVFDSTGTALQDVAAAVIVYEKALQQETCMRMNFAE
jgi:alanine dehydrogenase